MLQRRRRLNKMNGLIKDLGLLINATLIATPPLLLAALGSCFSERCGVVNIGIEGMMTIGAFTGAVMGLTTGNGWIAFLCAGLAGALFGLIHAFPATQTRRSPVQRSTSWDLDLHCFSARQCIITHQIHRLWTQAASFRSCLRVSSRQVHSGTTY